MANKKLIIVDMQNDFASVGGALVAAGADEAIKNAQKRILECKDSGEYDIIATMDTHYDNYLDTREGQYLPIPHCIKNTWGWELHPTIDYNFMDRILKENFSTEILKFNTDPEVIEICGICTDICVVSIALYLRMVHPTSTILVHADACAGTSYENHFKALDVMRSCQIEIVE